MNKALPSLRIILWLLSMRGEGAYMVSKISVVLFSFLKHRRTKGREDILKNIDTRPCSE